MTGHERCPDQETLAALLRGTLAPELEEHVTQHLEGCAACEARVQQLETLADPMVEALRQSSQRSEWAAQTMADPALPAAGIQLEGFEILGEIGRGGMGIVYRARQHRLNRIVAVKMIVSGQLADAEERVRFLLEGALLARLNHPNFVQVYEVGTVTTDSGAVQPYLVLEHVDGGTLRERLSAGPLDAAEAARLALCLARAMAVAHAQGIVHRDLKPANVLIAPLPAEGDGVEVRGPQFSPLPAEGARTGARGLGTLKISDFGLAKELSGDANLTPTGATLGTPSYMAPEQARGSRTIGPAADIYALGVMLYELLAGQPPFVGDTPMTILLQVLDKAPAALSGLRSRVPRDLETICLKCLEKEPQRRYSTAAALADDLELWLGGRPIRARPVGSLERLHKWMRRHPLSAALVVLLVLSLVGGIAVSTYFGITAQHRADETEQALEREAKARLASDRRAAELELLAGQRLAADGEVDRGLFTMVRGWRLAPEGDTDLQRVFQRNLEAWALYLPRVRWQTESSFRNFARFDGRAVIGSNRNEVGVHDVATGQSLGPPQAYAGDVVDGLSPDGKLVLTRTLRDQVVTLRVFERASGKAIATIVDARGGELWRGLPNRIYGERITLDNRFLLRWYRDPDLSEHQLFDLTTGNAAGPAVPGGTSQIEVVADAGGGLYWLFYEDNGRVVVKDVRTGTERTDAAAALPASARTAPVLFPHPDIVQGHFFDARTTWWNLPRSAAQSAPWQAPPGSRHGSPDGRHLVTVLGDQRLARHEFATRQPLAPTAAVGPGGTVVWVDGPTCLFLQPDRRIKLVDFPRLWPAHATGVAADSVFRGLAPVPGVRFDQAAFSPDRAAVLFGYSQSPGPLYYARLGSTAEQCSLGRPMTDCDSRGVFSPTGKLVALATRDGYRTGDAIVRVHDAHSGAPRGPAQKTDYFVHALAFSPDDRRLLVGTVKFATVVDLDTGATRTLKHPGPIMRSLWSDDGTRAALAGLGGWDKRRAGVQVWDVASGNPVGPFQAMNDAPLLIGVAGPTFQTLELESGRLREWDFVTGSPVADLGTLRDWPGAPGGERWAVRSEVRWFAHGSRQGLVRQWDLTTGRPLAVVADFHQPCERLQYAPDGRWLAVSGNGGDVALFDPLTGRQAGPLLTDRAVVRDLAFTADGAELLTATADGRCVHWPLAAAQRLTSAQWQLWLEAATGMQLDGPLLAPLAVADYQQRVAAASELGLPLRLPPRAAAAWHGEQAYAAEQAGQLNAALWHLDRWIAAVPTAWLPRARRARIHARLGDTAHAHTDLKQAAALARATDLDDWKLHEAVIGRITGQPLKLE
jgi:eukaryotic-like serine/threonine-protein kinase